MAIELKLPDMGEGTEDVTISRWLVSDGDEVAEGDVVLEVATDKVDTEVTAPASGKLLQRNFSEGELAPVDAVLALIGAEGEAVETDESAPEPPEAEKRTPETQREESRATADGDEETKASPVARRMAAEKGIALAEIAGSGPGGRITKEDVLAAGDQPGDDAQSALPEELANVP
ncbi:MAG: hypothetical protein HC802_01825 [Caldilineaceae bacterium]|nr:hypothetical protein [Caldilineaceae bacterium]